MLTISYARTEITLTVLLGAAATVVVAWLFGWWALLPAILTLALLSFYRHPHRRIPAGPYLLAPADGRVVAVQRNFTDADGDAPSLRIMIFLAVYNVHVNRSPCAGRVAQVSYKPGQFLNALNADADTCNECNTVLIEPQPPLPGPVRIRQIAGVLARRIVCAIQVGDQLAAGQPLGMIKLGSRTELRAAEHPGWEVLVGVGARVRAGETVLARFHPTPGGQPAVSS